MNKKRKFDFILENYDEKRLIFRFYPRQSSLHSHDDKPPTSWDEVYKVYYNYAIIKQYKPYKTDKWESQVLFHSKCDECSIIDEVGYRCKILSEGFETVKYIDSFGEEHWVQLTNNKMMPCGIGVDWTIRKYESYNNEVLYEFSLFDWNNVGFRFSLKENRIIEFGDYLLECCKYMLQHGEPI